MSQIKATEIEGDVAVSRHVITGGNATIQGNTTVKKNLIVDGWLYARNFKGPDKGWFKNEQLLKSTHPTPQPGQWALVGDGCPAKIYMVENGQWQDSGKILENVVVDIEGYEAQIAEALPKQIKFDDLDTMGYADKSEFLIAAYDKPLLPTRYAVTGPGTETTAKVVGILDVFSASSFPDEMCTITQMLTTNIVFNPQTGKFEGHQDNRVFRYVRYLHLSGTDIGVETGEWTGWWFDDATAARRAHDNLFKPESLGGKEMFGVLTVPTGENEDKSEAVRVEPYADVADIRFHFATSAGGGAHRVRIPEAHLSTGDDDPHVTGVFGKNAYDGTVAAAAAKAAAGLKLHNFGTVSVDLSKLNKFGDTLLSEALSTENVDKIKALLKAVDEGYGVTGSFSVYKHPTGTKFDVMNLESNSAVVGTSQGMEYRFRCLFYDATNDNVRLRIARIVLKKVDSNGNMFIAPVTVRQIDLPLNADLNIDLTQLSTKAETAATATAAAVALVKTLYSDRTVWDFTSSDYHTPTDAADSMRSDAQAISPGDLMMLFGETGALKVYAFFGADSSELLDDERWVETDIASDFTRLLNRITYEREQSRKLSVAMVKSVFADRKVWDFTSEVYATITQAINSLSAEDKLLVETGCLALLRDENGAIHCYRCKNGNRMAINRPASWKEIDLLSEMPKRRWQLRPRVLHKRMISYYSKQGEVYSVVSRMRIPNAQPGDSFNLTGIVRPGRTAAQVLTSATISKTDEAISGLFQLGQNGSPLLSYDQATQTLTIAADAPVVNHGYLITIETDVISLGDMNGGGLQYVTRRKCHGGFGTNRQLVEMYEDVARKPRPFYLQNLETPSSKPIGLTEYQLVHLFKRRDIEIEQFEWRTHRRYSLHWRSRGYMIFKEALQHCNFSEAQAATIIAENKMWQNIPDPYKGPHSLEIETWRRLTHQHYRRWVRIGGKRRYLETAPLANRGFRLYNGRTYVRFRRRGGGRHSDWTYYWMTIAGTEEYFAWAYLMNGEPAQGIEQRLKW